MTRSTTLSLAAVVQNRPGWWRQTANGWLIADDADHGPADLTELRIPGEVPGLLVPRAVARSVVLDGHPRIGGPEGKRGDADRGVGLDD